MGRALRLGMIITIVGAFSAGFMTHPTTAQLDGVHAGQGMPIMGAHTVGAPDGGPGLSGTGWSTEHGDLRIPHFIGLHALQILPLIAFMMRRRRLKRYTSRSDADCGRELLHIGRAAAHTGAPWAADSKAGRAHIRAIRRMGPRHGDLWLEVG